MLLPDNIRQILVNESILFNIVFTTTVSTIEFGNGNGCYTLKLIPNDGLFL